MKEKEEIKTQVGIFNLPGNMAFPNDKVLKLFTKLKRRAKQVSPQMETRSQSPSGPGGEGTPIQDLEPNFAELRQSSMNSYRLQDEVVKTENGFDVM